MPKYLIERKIPGAGQMTPAQLQETAAKSNAVLGEMGKDIQWVQSYVVQDKVYCVYNAKGPEVLREHARRGGFPADVIMEVKAVIDPVTAERKEALLVAH